MKFLCKIFGHKMFFDTHNVCGPSTCKRCNHKKEGIKYPENVVPLNMVIKK